MNSPNNHPKENPTQTAEAPSNPPPTPTKDVETIPAVKADEIPHRENIAATVARLVPQVKQMFGVNFMGTNDPARIVMAVPNGHRLEVLNFESLGSGPRQARGLATLSDADSFIAYMNDFGLPGTSVVWCDFNPVTSKLAFHGVMDEHKPKGVPGWRGHGAAYTPAMSVEWQRWTAQDCKPMTQIDFADFLEKHEDDIANVEGYPNSLDMHRLATEFVARQEQSIKSMVRLRDGGVTLHYVADSDANTIEQMKVFDKFAVGIPVFWTTPDYDETNAALPIPAYRIDARLRYRFRDGKVMFWYELIRPDKVHQMAALDMIDSIRGNVDPLPIRMGGFA